MSKIIISKKILLHFSLFILLNYTYLNSALLENINSYSSMEQAAGNTSLLTLDNNSSITFNPAVDIIADKNSITGFFSSSFMNLPLYMLSFQIIKSNVNFGMGISYHKSEDFSYIDIYGNSLSTITYNEVFLLFHISKSIKNIIGIGINPKILIQHIDTDTEYSINFDIGIVTKKINILDIGFSTGIVLKNAVNNYMLSYDISANLLSLKTTELKAAVNITTKQFKNISVNIGSFLYFFDKYSLILGYKINNYTYNNFSTGIGIKLKKLNFNYSFLPSTLYNAHSITIKYRF